ncbi:MAG: glycosyltransferase family 2 protein [Nitrososphaerales archaeon]
MLTKSIATTITTCRAECDASHRNIIDEKIAIVMPVCNEGATIEFTVSEIARKLMRFLPNALLFIFEDGSRDNTKEVIKRLSLKYDWIRPHDDEERKGYSKAVRDALVSIDEDEFEYLLFMDSDGQYDPNDFFKLWDAVIDGAITRDEKLARLCIVSARRVNRTEPPYRIFLSTGLRILERILFNPQCNDVTSAFRVMDVSAAKAIASKVRFSEHNFWLEFTARASKEGYNFCEIPINYRCREWSYTYQAKKAKSNIYDIKVMPEIIKNELGALTRTWLEYSRSSRRSQRSRRSKTR